jgi:hypothetical protein
MLDNWEAEKARILQDELGVTDDELARLAGSLNGSGSGSGGGLAGSTLGRSALGASTRRVNIRVTLQRLETVFRGDSLRGLADPP